ncbi:LGFP repeat-containing protein [soil metagenome]
MTTQRNPFRWATVRRLQRRSWATGRLALGLIAATAMVTLLAPPIANATPETDADDAINAVWAASGGDTSQLGPKDGGVYPVGSGFGQNFAGGAVYFTPETGARAMFGAILDKYREQGGPADSDLGFPNIDEGPGRVSPDSRNTTFSAADNPVIFWTPDTGAWVVRGPINAAWDKLGGSAGVLGVPTADETYNGAVISQTFTGGQLSYDTDSKQFTTVPPELADQLVDLPVPGDATSAINTAWRAAGGAAGPLGLKQGDQSAIGDNGAEQDFAGGKVFYTPDTGAHVVSGAILDEYQSLGGPTGELGFPSAGEADGGVPGSRVSAFAGAGNPVIFWTAEHGAIPVRGAMKAAWDKLGGASGELGVPVSDQNTDGDTVTQKFSGGQVSFNSKDSKFTTDPANLAESLAGLQVPAQSAAPAAPATPAPEAKSDNTFEYHSWWLWWIVPLAILLLASLAALGWLIVRRRSAGRDGDYHDDDDADYHDDAADPEHWASTDAESPDNRDRFVDPDAENSAYASSRVGWPDAEVAPAPERRWSDTITGADSGSTPSVGLFTHHGAHETEDDEPEDAEEDPDSVDTAPTQIQDGDTETEHSGRHAALGPDTGRSVWTAPDDDSYLPEPQSLFAPVYGAAPPPPSSEWDDIDSTAEVMEPDIRDEVVAPPAIHLPLADPAEAPEGYPIKGSMRSGRYHTPDSDSYDQTVAEIWFATEELAQANGFTKAE